MNREEVHNRVDNHCRDCCCARSWAALGITEYTGMSIPEHIQVLLDKLEAVEREYRDSLFERILTWRGVELGSECQACSGSGKRVYGDTSTWHRGVGGQMVTAAVCDKCWGSGDKTRGWTDLRKLESQLAALKEENEKLKGDIQRWEELYRGDQKDAQSY